MQIENGLLKGARFVKANASGGAMSPRAIILHDTAGALRPFSSVEWFASKQCGTSAHFVVERDGTITQMVPTNKKAFHAGQSKWKGIVGLNSCSVGIEIVSPGKLDNSGNAYFGKAADPAEIVALNSKAHGGPGYWLPYTPEQTTSVVAICRAVVEEYPDCNEILTHYEISPGRKIDVGPQFPLEDVRKAVFDPPPEAIEETTPAPSPPPSMTASAASSLLGGLAALRSVWRQIWAPVCSLALWIVTQIQAAILWLTDRVEDAVQMVTGVQKDVEGGLAPFRALGGLLKANMSLILPTLAAILTVFAIIKLLRKPDAAGGAP